MDKYISANRKLWNGWTSLHEKSAFYDVSGFKTSKDSLTSIEREELGDVSGQSLLHLQCHFGLDTLSFAHRGAHVTGMDFSPKGIEIARSLATELNINAEFICSDIYELPDNLDRKFEIVFTSYGVLSWLPDIDRWGELVARYLVPSGVFYIVEFHPVLGILDDDGDRIQYPYFSTPEPLRFEESGSYAAPESDFKGECYQWTHSLGQIVTSLVKAGLRIEYLHEFDYSPFNCYHFLREEGPGRWVVDRHRSSFPVLFSIRARRP